MDIPKVNPSKYQSSIWTYSKSLARCLVSERGWRAVGLSLKATRSVAVDVASVLGIVVFALFIWRQATPAIVQIDPISVPPRLAAEGYTGDVIAQRIMDRIMEIHGSADASVAKLEVHLPGHQPDMALPGLGFSVGTIAAYVADVFGVPRRLIKGEITEQGDRLILQLRVSEIGALPATTEIERARLEDAIKSAAESVVFATEPYIHASYMYGRDETKALDELDDIIENESGGDQTQVRALHLRGVILASLGRYEEATNDFNRAIALDSEFVPAYVGKGRAYIKRNSFDDAIATFREAARIDPANSDPHAGLGDALRSQGRNRESVEAYQAAIALDHKNSTALIGLGHAQLALAQINDAFRSFREAIKFSPNQAAAFDGLGDAYGRQGNMKEAIDNYRRAIAMDPGDPLLYVDLGTAYLNANQRKDAVGAFQEAISLDPKLASAHLGLGKALYVDKRLEEAVVALRAATRLSSNNLSAYFSLATALEKLGDVKRQQYTEEAEALFNEACGVFLTASRVDLTNYEYKNGLARVNSKLPVSKRCPSQ